MKINPSHIDKIYGQIAAEAATTAAREGLSKPAVDRDSLTLSDAARKHSETDAAVRMAADEALKPTAPERLLKYKNAIQNGTYRVSAEDIASAMLGSGGSES